MTIRLEAEDAIRILTLDRPEAANALSREMLSDIAQALKTVLSDEGARVLIVTGTGRTFCAGADLKEREGMSDEQVLETVTTIRETVSAVAGVPIPVIAAINGAAFGGGLELALACDLRIAASSARMGLTETTLAIIPGGGGTQRLPRLIGPGRAKNLIFTGRRLTAAEALSLGVVDEVWEPELLLGHARELARTIAANGPIAVRAAKEAIDRGLSLPLEQALALETELYARTIATADRAEGLAAFREKRRPNYNGE